MRWVWSDTILDQLSDLRDFLPSERTISLRNLDEVLPGEFKVFVLSMDEINSSILGIDQTDWVIQLLSGSDAPHDRSDFLMTLPKLEQLIRRGDLLSLGSHVLFEKPFHDLIHDIRTPLSVIYTGFEILIMKKAVEEPEQILDKICTAKAHLERIKMMTSNFVDMIRTREVPFFMREENPGVLSEQVLRNQTSRLHMEKKQIRLSCTVDRYELDRNVFKQMVFNLIEHGIYFGNQSPMSLRVEEDKGLIKVTLTYEGCAELTPVQMSQVFETESRIKDAVTGINYNKGFGLTYNKKMSKLLHGDAGIEYIQGPGILTCHLWFTIGKPDG